MFGINYAKIKGSLGVTKETSSNPASSVDAQRDWKVLCLIFLISAFTILMADIYFFYARRYYVSDTSKIVLESSVSLDKARLNKVIANWKNREIEFNKLIDEDQKLVDPSI